ncbi:T9SS type A sorting domain-containing protein [Ekhidna sp.]|uniref:T9SS type A sorting domain-containing protein n=1 Tax=Ekhidna sp. TaxID=2608089 RepID=UPI003B50A8B7
MRKIGPSLLYTFFILLFSFSSYAQPTVISATTVDSDGNGIVDRLEIQFSEPIDDSDFTVNAIADWTLDDGSGAVSFDGFNTTVGADTDADDEYVTLTISAGVSGTDAMNYAYTNDGGGADDISNVGETGILADITTVAATDGADIVVIQAITLDVGGDGTVETMELELSEPIDDSDFTANAIADWTLDDGGGAASFDAFNTTTNVVSGGADADADDEFIALTISAGVSGTGVMNYAYTNDGGGGDDINDLDNGEVLADIGATAAADGATPILLAATTVDAGGNGIVEGLELQFSESMVDADFTANAIADWTLDDGGGAASFDGFSTTTNVVSGGADTDANDEYVTLTISAGVSGTDAMNYAYTNDGGGADDITDGTNVLADIGTTGATDGADIVVIQAITLDVGGDGTVETMELELSEPIDDSDFTANAIADWTLDDGGGAASFDAFNTTTNVVSGGADADADDEFIVLTISAGVSGTGVMNYAYTNDGGGGDDINDLDNGEVLADIGATAAADGATPILLAATTVDAGGNGIVEGLELQFSESMVDADFTANAIADWTLDDGGGAASFDGFSTTTNVVSGGADTDANDEYVTLTISAGVSGTDAMNYAYTNDGGGADDITDGTNVLADIGTTGATDGADIVVIQAITLDVGGDGTVETMELELSEPIDDSDFTANAIADWTLDDGGGAASFDAFNTTTNVVSGGADADADDEFIALTISAGVSGTGVMNYAYTNDGGGGDDINDLDNGEVLADIGATAAADGATPILLAATTVDAGGNGIVEGLELQFSESMVDADFTANAIADWTLDDGGGAASFDGFSTTTNVVSGGADTDANDEYVTLTISAGVSGTDAMNYAYTNDGGGADDITDGTNVLADIGTTGATDGADIVVIQAITLDVGGDGTVETMELELSEPIDDSDFTANAIADWTLDDGGGAASFDAFNTTTNVVSGGADADADDEFIVLTISAGVSGTGVMNYAYTNDGGGGDDINDLDNGEVLADIGATAAADGATPILLAATTVDAGGNGIVEGLELQFSESMVDADFTANAIADWTLDDGGGAASFDGFSTTTNVVSGGADTDANDEYVTLTISAGVSGTDAMNYAYTNDGGGADDITDGTNVLADIGTTGATDGADIVVIQAITLDVGGDGTVETMELELSEPIDDSDFTANAIADWTLDDGGGAASFDAFNTTTNVVSGGADADADDEFIALTISAGVSGTGVMNYAYTNDGGGGDDINDLDNGEVLADIGATAAADGATPILLAATTVDAGGNGIVEGLELQFSESMVDADFTANAIADWTLDDGGGAASFDGFSTTTNVVSGGADTDANDEYVTLTISAGVSGTDAMNYAYTNDGGGADDITDGTNVLADIGTTGATDGADIVVIQAITLDVGGDGTVETMELELSEPIDDSDFTANAIADWTLDDGGGAASFDAFNTTTNVVSGGADADADDEFIALTISAGVSGTGVMNYAYTNDGGGGDDINDLDNGEVLADIGATAADDGADPVLISAVTGDNDTNGQIDRVIVTFSETMEFDDIDATPTAGADDFTDDFVVTGYDIITAATLAGGSTDDDEIVITLAESGSPDTDATPNLTITVGELGDLATVPNTNAASSGAVSDGAAPVILSATTDDVGGTSGEIDLITVVLSEPIDGSTLDQTVGGGTTSQFALGGGYQISSIDTQVGGAANDDIIEIVLVESTNPDTDATPTLTFTSGTLDDLATPSVNTTLGYSAAVTDGAAPVIYSSFLQGSNSYLQVVFSEEIYRSAGGSIVLGDFDQSITLNSGPNPTTLNFNDATTLGGDPLGAVEDTILFVINIDPGFGTYENDDDVSISTDGTTIEDAVGISLSGTETAGPYTIQDLINFPQILTASYTVTGANSGYIELVFSEGLYRDASTNRSPMLANTNNDGTIKNGDYTNGTSLCDEDELCITYTQNGGATINDNNNSDIDWRRDTGASLANNVDYSSDTYRIYFFDLPNGQFRGVETYRFAARSNTQIRGRTTDAYMPNPGDYFFDFNLPDVFAEDFDDLVTADVEAHDTDADGNIDEIVVTFLDDIDDASLAASLSDFTINGGTNNGISPSSVVATPLNGVDPNVANDNIFTLAFTSYTGTNVDGTLDFAGTLTFADDAGNLILAGSVTPTDAAGPVIQSAITADNDLNGQIDEITVTFSEPFSDNGIDDTDFSLSGGYTIPVAGFSVSSPDVTLTLNESGSSDTYITPDVSVDVADILRDLSAATASNPIHTFTNTDDGAAPYFTITTSSPTVTTDPTPDLSGTIDDPNATVLISIGANSALSATNDGIGGWTLSGGLLTNPLGLQTYSVSYTTFDLASPINIRTATVPNVIEVQGGVLVEDATASFEALTGAEAVTVCIGDQVSLPTIRVAETNPTDFSSTGTYILNLPAGFVFDTGATLSILSTSVGNNISIGTVEYIGTSSLSIELIDDGDADVVDVITIDGLIVEGTGSTARTNSVITVSGDVGILTNQTSFGDLSSLLSPDALTDLEDTADPGTPITEYITKYLPRVRVDYTLGNPIQMFTPGEVVNFSGGASGIINTDNGLNQMQVNLTSGTVANAETITEVSSGFTATTTANAVGLTRDLLPFSLEASPTVTSNWYFDGVVDPTPDLTTSINSNAALLATTPGLFTYAITDDDATCESAPLLFNVLVYNDVHPDNDSRTFVDQVLSVNGSIDTIYLSNPANHTVSLTGNGISVVGGGADPLVAYFDPAVAGDNGGVGETHTITYSVTNDNTGENLIVQADFEVVPETEFFTPALDDAYCISEFPLAGNLTIEEATFYTSNPSNFFQIYFDNFISANAQGLDKTLDNSYMYFYNNALFSFQAAYGSGVTFEFPFDPQTWSGLAFGGNGFGDDFIMAPGEGSIFYVERNRFDNMTSQSTIEFDFLEVYGRPYVQISGLNTQYCDSDTDLVTINRSVKYVNDFESTNPNDQYAQWEPSYVTLEEVIANGYYLYRSIDGISYSQIADFTSGGTLSNVFNPNDPDQDGNTFADDGDTDDIGYFRIIYDTEALGPESCVGSTSFDFYVNPRPAMLELGAATLAAGRSIGFVNTDEYQLEYCVGATPAGFTAINFEDGQLIYSSSRTATLTHPNSPTYTVGETIKGATSGATAQVITDNGTTMTIGDINGNFEVGEIIKGQTTLFNSAISAFNETTTNFRVGETITSFTGSAQIVSDKGNVLGLDNLVGTFSAGQTITGATSGTMKTIVVSSNPTDITWYDQNQNPLPAAVNFNPTVNIAAVGLSTTGADQAEFYFSTTGSSGCESDLRKVTVNIFDIPDAPVIDASAFPPAAQNGNIYTFDYCVEDGGASTTPDALILDDLLDDDRYNVTREFRDFSAGSVIIDMTTITEIDGNTDTSDESIPVPDIFAGDSIIFTITKTENISIAPDNVFSDFPGCTSTDAITIRILAHEEAGIPTESDFVAGTTEFHICEGDPLGNISHTFIAGTDEYTWYESIDGGSNGVTRIGDVLGVGDPMTEAILGSASTIPSNFVDVPGVYTVYVSRNNDVVDSRDFDGCESEAIPVSITVHGIQDAVTIVSDNSANPSVPLDFPNIDPDDDDFFEFAVCSDQLFADLAFEAQNLYAGDERVEWYNASTGNLLFTGERPTFADLFLVGLGAQIVTYEVIQVTDTLTDSFGNFFDGCNSDIATIQITIADPAELTVVDALDAEISNSYCRDDDPEGDGDIDVFIRVGTTLLTDPTDVGYEINSYLQSTYDANDPADIDGPLINGSFPVLDLVALHDALPGAMDIGGESTVHELIMYYTDPASFCTGSVTKVITINPDPHISFEVFGVDINEANFTSGFNNFCYEQGNVTLRGVQYIYDNTGITDTINLTSGQFSSDQLGALGSNIGEGTFNPRAEHNAAYGETGQGAKYLNRTANGSVITFNFTDDNGCQISVAENLYIEPEPEVYDVERVTDLDPADLASDRLSNIIRIQDFCNDGSDAQVTVVLVDPTGGEDDVLTDYTNYGFEWTINGDPVPDDGFGNPVIQVGTNTLTFTPSSTNVNVRVDVTDPNLCTETFTEVHQLQALPDLDFPEIFNFEEFCADDANVSLSLDDYIGGQTAASIAGVISWEVLSFNTNRTDTVNNPVEAGWSTATVDQDLGGGSFPTVDIQNWHQGAGGVSYVNGRSVGGNSTVHTIYITYQDLNREYQGIATNCSVTYSETIIINPNPDITILVDNNDINGFLTGQDQFCYDENTIELAGVSAPDSSSLFTSVGQFVLVVGLDDDFSTETNDLNIPTSNNTAFVNAFDLHDEYWNIINGTTGVEYPYETQSSSLIQFEYTDENGCFNFVETTLFVDPVPEEISVNNGSPQDGNIFFITDICNDNSNQITAEVRFIDPADPAGTTEEDDYSGYTFTWSLDGQIITTVPSNGELNTNVISVSDRDFVVEVDVTDLNGCTVNYSEFHSKQDLPDLDFDEIFNFQEFCSDDAVPTLTLVDFIGGSTVVDESDVVSWQVLSYQTNRKDTIENAVNALWADATVDQDADGASIPQINLQTWHEGAGGATFSGGKSIGGNSTVHSIYVTYIDPSRSYQGLSTLCETTYVETIIINPNPDISFTLEGVDMDNIELCYDDTGIQLIGVNNVTRAPLGDGVFDIPGIALSTNNGEAVFTAADAHGADPYAPRSTHSVEYTYQDANGCENTVLKTFFVNPRPEFVGTNINDDIDGIQVANSCASDSIRVFVEMTDDSDLYIYEWSVNGNVEQTQSGAAGGDTLVYALSQGETTANFSVTATYDPTAPGASFTTVCEAVSLSKSVTVGQEPIPAISWVGLTAIHPNGTDFTIYEDNSELGDADIDSVYLSIDGTVVNTWNGDPTNPLVFPLDYNYVFTASGSYGVDLRITTIAGCDVTISRTIDIIPHFTSFNSNNTYSEDFVSSESFDLTSPNGGWLVETRSLDGKTDDLITTWAWGTTPPGSGNGTGSVYTSYNSIPNPEANREISFVYSPSFDISGFSSPTISIQRYAGFVSFRDGAVLQYTEDDGRTWINVGSYNSNLPEELASTPGWYDREAITAAPGTQAPAGENGQNNPGIGWATVKGDPGSDWQLAISPLGVTDDRYVRFRFALSGQAGGKEDAEGFAFDDFRIYDRDQIVLVELFSSTLNDLSIAFNDAIDNDPNYNGTDILTINYFTDFANGGGAGIDQINLRNTRDPGAKSSFYGISDVPSIAISGDAFLVEDIASQLNELEARLNNAKLEEPIFDILVTASVEADNTLDVDATFTATADLPNDAEIGLFVAVVEPQVILSQDMGGYNAGDRINNVLRKLLPNAAGQYVQGPINDDDVLSITDQKWQINNMFDPTSFKVIVYAQDLNSKKVYQAESTIVTGGAIILGTENELSDVSLYPNPADKEVILEFAFPLSDKTEWIIYDQAGREVQEGEMSKGTKKLTVETTEMPSGLYFIHLYGEDRKRQSKRVIVLH